MYPYSSDCTLISGFACFCCLFKPNVILWYIPIKALLHCKLSMLSFYTIRTKILLCNWQNFNNIDIFHTKNDRGKHEPLRCTGTVHKQKKIENSVHCGFTVLKANKNGWPSWIDKKCSAILHMEILSSLISKAIYKHPLIFHNLFACFRSYICYTASLHQNWIILAFCIWNCSYPSLFLPKFYSLISYHSPH